MFFSHSLLARKGSLGKVWLAAHWDKKLNKQTILQTDIKATVGAYGKKRREGSGRRGRRFGGAVGPLLAVGTTPVQTATFASRAHRRAAGPPSLPPST